MRLRTPMRRSSGVVPGGRRPDGEAGIRPTPCSLFLYFGSGDPNDNHNTLITRPSQHRLICALGLHVDDILGAGESNHPEVQDIKLRLQKAFSFHDFREIRTTLSSSAPKSTSFRRVVGASATTNIKPIHVDKARMVDPTAAVSEAERSWSARPNGLRTRLLLTCRCIHHRLPAASPPRPCRPGRQQGPEVRQGQQQCRP